MEADLGIVALVREALATVEISVERQRGHETGSYLVAELRRPA